MASGCGLIIFALGVWDGILLILICHELAFLVISKKKSKVYSTFVGSPFCYHVETVSA